MALNALKVMLYLDVALTIRHFNLEYSLHYGQAPDIKFRKKRHDSLLINLQTYQNVLTISHD